MAIPAVKHEQSECHWLLARVQNRRKMPPVLAQTKGAHLAYYHMKYHSPRRTHTPAGTIQSDSEMTNDDQKWVSERGIKECSAPEEWQSSSLEPATTTKQMAQSHVCCKVQYQWLLLMTCVYTLYNGVCSYTTQNLTSQHRYM